MANASPKARGPNATYIPPACVGARIGLARLRIRGLDRGSRPEQGLVAVVYRLNTTSPTHVQIKKKVILHLQMHFIHWWNMGFTVFHPAVMGDPYSLSPYKTYHFRFWDFFCVLAFYKRKMDFFSSLI